MDNLTAVHIFADMENQLADAARRRQPYEICGVIFGKVTAHTLVADGFSLLRNNSPTPASTFAFDPQDWIHAYYDAQKNQREIVGFFHSHPEGSPIPSRSDDQGYVPWGTYWIVGLTENKCEIAVYVRDSQGGWIRVPILRGKNDQCRLK